MNDDMMVKSVVGAKFMLIDDEKVTKENQWRLYRYMTTYKLYQYASWILVCLLYRKYWQWCTVEP
jgi:hypothetical protein